MFGSASSNVNANGEARRLKRERKFLCYDLHPVLDAVLRQSQSVLVGPCFALELLEEPLIVPDLEILDATEHTDVADDRRALTEMRWDDDATLVIELARLTVVIDPVEEFQTRRMVSGHLHQPALDLEPDGHRIDADRLSGETRDEYIRPLLVLDVPSEAPRYLESAFIIDPGRGAPPHPVVVHLTPKISTWIVRGTSEDVNRQTPDLLQVTPNFRQNFVGQTAR